MFTIIITDANKAYQWNELNKIERLCVACWLWISSTYKMKINRKIKVQIESLESIDYENRTQQKDKKNEGEILLLHFHLIVFPAGSEATKI